jgi:Uma2 family endonuclease
MTFGSPATTEMEIVMASAARITRYTPEQYLAMERKADFKSEYEGGFITGMAGASTAHNLIALNFSSEIRSQLKGRPCMVFMSDMRLCVGPTGLYTYPDAMAVCGERQFLDAEVDTLLNPAIIIEVLSTTTESYERGRKFRHYQQLASLQGYVLVAQDGVRVERFTRRGDDWILSMFTRLEDTLRLESIDCEVPLREIYDKVELSEEAARAAWLKRG